MVVIKVVQKKSEHLVIEALLMRTCVSPRPRGVISTRLDWTAPYRVQLQSVSPAETGESLNSCGLNRMDFLVGQFMTEETGMSQSL